MHEFGLAEGVLAAVRRRAGGRPVRRVRLRAGVRHGVDADSMAQAFRFVAAGTEAEGAGLDLVTLPVHLACRSCGYTGDTVDVLSACPQCHADDVELTGGDELVLESLEYR
ncbi:MAG: hydrogenase maturation nickel metallochaperone HypA [Actinobacteria bacterium]|nr:MAG: hydrogenase maturation nickel metallochaperone HypA [Actinomycetota bacterium]